MGRRPAIARSQDAIRIAELSQKAVDLRREHKSFREISAALGVSLGVAHKYVTRYLEETRKLTAEKAEQLRDIETQRLDALCSALWGKAMKGDTRSAEALLRTMESRRKLLGLDAPASSAVVVDSRPETVRALMALATGTAPAASADGVVDIAPAEEEPA